jgi:uncharacterized protein (TIGR00255 family)
MIKSMTGFGRSEALGRSHKIQVEIRALNSRYLDIHVRLPHGTWSIEPLVRRIIRSRLKRGRIEVSVHLEPLDLEDTEDQVTLQLGRAKAYLKALEKLRQELSLPGEVDLSLISSFRDLFWIHEGGLEGEEEAISRAVEWALDAVEQMRSKEGDSLFRDLNERLTWLEQEVGKIEAKTPRVMEDHLHRWRTRLESMLHEKALDPSRMEQETAFWMEKMDINEELVRLKSHIAQFRALLQEGDGVGRKLEFLLQEMLREANTIGTKAMDAGISHSVVEVKAQLERMREQAQNIE